MQDIRSAKDDDLTEEASEAEEAPVEEAADQITQEIENLNKDLDDLKKNLEDTDPVETAEDAVFEVVEDKPEE